MAGAEERISAACRISLADSTCFRRALAILASQCLYFFFLLREAPRGGRSEKREQGTYLSLGNNDLALSHALALSSHGQGFLELGAEDHVLDEHGLDLHAPAGGNGPQ